jgi:hypothetical protein
MTQFINAAIASAASASFSVAYVVSLIVLRLVKLTLRPSSTYVLQLDSNSPRYANELRFRSTVAGADVSSVIAAPYTARCSIHQISCRTRCSPRGRRLRARNGCARHATTKSTRVCRADCTGCARRRWSALKSINSGCQFRAICREGSLVRS